MLIVYWDIYQRYEIHSIKYSTNKTKLFIILQGVIRDEKDLDYLGNDFKNEFQTTTNQYAKSRWMGQYVIICFFLSQLNKVK